MMTEDQLNEIEAHAGNLMTLKEIAEIIEVDYESLKLEYDQEKDVFKRYRKGFLLKKSQLNKAAIEQAISGSSPAMGQVQKMIDNMPS